MKIGQFQVKFGSKSAEIRYFFSQFLAAAFLARNVSQNHFSFSREMREMCRSNFGLQKVQKCIKIKISRELVGAKKNLSKQQIISRHAHFSHFSREREMVLRDISREKCGARNCEKNRPIFGHFGPQFGQNSSNFQCRVTQIELKVLHQLISYDFVNF